MKKDKKSIDELIKEAMAQEVRELDQNFEEENIFELLTSTFKGKMKWLAMLSAVFMLLMFIFFVYCAIQFFNTTVVREMIIWGAGAFIGINAVGLLKTWHFMQMDKNALMREIKRLELHIALLHKSNMK